MATPSVPWWLRLVCGLVLLFLVIPVFVVVPISFSAAPYLEFPPRELSLQWYREYFFGRGWLPATVLSFQVATVVTLVATVLGTAASFGLVRGTFPGKGLVYGLLLSPLIVPAIVTAIAVYFLYARLRLVGSWSGLVVAHTVLTVPIVVVIVSAALRGFDVTLERAALSLGASPLQAFRRVTLPLIAPAVVTAALFAFLMSFDEVVVAIFIGGTHAVTLPKKMWEGIRLEITPTIAAASSLLILLAITLVVTTQLLRQRMARLNAPQRQEGLQPVDVPPAVSARVEQGGSRP